MNIRKLSLAVVAIAACAPVLASASPEDVALHACAKAFAASVAGGASAPAFKLNYDQKLGTDTIAGYYVRDYSFTMQARDPKTGATLASATCSASNRGAVLSLTPAGAATSVALASR